jgi:hypothetical protein
MEACDVRRFSNCVCDSELVEDHTNRSRFFQKMKISTLRSNYGSICRDEQELYPRQKEDKMKLSFKADLQTVCN